MFEVLKPLIEQSERLDEKIGDLCKAITKELNEIEQSDVNNWTQERLDKIRSAIDYLETDTDFSVESEIDDLKEEFLTMDKSLEVYAKYKNESSEEMQKKIDTFFHWEN